MENNFILQLYNNDNTDLLFQIETSVSPYPWTKNMFIEEVDNQLSEVYLIKINDNIEGYVIIRKYIDELEISNIAISKSFQNQGYGSKSISFVIEYAKKLAFSKIFLEVRNDNYSAIKLYEKHGFVQIGRRKNYYFNMNTSEKCDALIYVLKIDIS